MQKTSKMLLILVFIISLTSCKNKIENHDLLIASWVEDKIDDSITTYKNVRELDEDNYGFTFKPDGIFIERKNSGWCGTPPISYDNFEGTWVRKDSILKIETTYWGGQIDYKWQILSLNNNELKIILLEREYHEAK